MAKLEIKKIKGIENAHTMRDFDILIDGHEPSGLMSLNINLDAQEFNTAEITLLVDDLEVDGDFLTMIQAKVDDNSKVKGD